jgi:hypothetical protein
MAQGLDGRDLRALLALAALLALLGASAGAGQPVSTPDGAEREWTGTIESVETQTRTLLLHTGEGTRKLLYEPEVEILEGGERVDVTRLEPGARVRVDVVKRGFDFVAVLIVLEAEENRT